MTDYTFYRINHFRYMGKGIYGFFTDKQGRAASGSDKNLPAALRPESIFLINLVCPKPYLIIAPETKTTDTTERRIKKKSDNREADKMIETQLPHLLNPHKLKKTAVMKTRYKIAVLALVAVAGSAVLGGGFWWWLVGIIVGKFVIRLVFTIALAIVIYCLVYALIIGGIFWLLIS